MKTLAKKRSRKSGVPSKRSRGSHMPTCGILCAPCDRVAEKITWVSQRKTTKIEDTAYYLLGLFNVSLPIAYGEADGAWYRLMTVIANECTDTSFFAWAGQPSPYSRTLPSSPASYLKLDSRTSASTQIDTYGFAYLLDVCSVRI